MIRAGTSQSDLSETIHPLPAVLAAFNNVHIQTQKTNHIFVKPSYIITFTILVLDTKETSGMVHH